MTHDMSEFWTPQPKIVTPPDMDNAVVAPPSDAVVLLGLKDNAISEWVNCEEGKPVGWQIENGIMTVKPHSGSIRTKKDFGDFQLHLEWSAPTEIVGESQGRGNSGVFMQGMYEVQILDNYQNETYANGQAGSIYKQTPPLVNACQKPGKWNTYDIIYTAPRFKDDGTLHSHGRITVLHNGEAAYPVMLKAASGGGGKGIGSGFGGGHGRSMGRRQYRRAAGRIGKVLGGKNKSRQPGRC